MKCLIFTEVVCNSSCPIALKSTTFSLVVEGKEFGSVSAITFGADRVIASLVSETILSFDGFGKTFDVGATVVFSGCLVIGGAMASSALPAIIFGANAAIGFVPVRGLGLVGENWIGVRRAISLEETFGGQF